jgi:hypothetical protein
MKLPYVRFCPGMGLQVPDRLRPDRREAADSIPKEPTMKDIYSDYSHGMSLREAKRRCRALGILCELVRRTGEVRFSHPGFPPVTHSNHRPTASRALVNLLRDVAGGGRGPSSCAPRPRVLS